MTAAIPPTTRQAESLGLNQQVALPPGSWVLSILVPGLVAVTAAVLLGVLAHQFQILTRDREQSQHLTAAMRTVTELRATYLSGLAGIRQYLDNGDASYLKLFDQALVDLPERYAELNRDNLRPNEIAQLKVLRSLCDSTMELAAKMRDEYQAQHRMTPALGNYTGHLIDNMNQSRGMFSAFITALNTRFNANERATTAQLRRTGWYALSVGIAGGLVALVLSGVLLKHMRRRTEMAHQLQTSLELRRGTLGNLAQGLAVFNMDRQLVFWNEQFERLTGIASGSLYDGMHYRDVVRVGVPTLNSSYEAEINKADENFALLVAGQTIQHERRRLDGLTVRIDVRPITDNHYMLALSDITLIRNSEATARDQAMRLAAIMDTVPDGIITIKPDGMIESWSEGAQRIFGYRAEHIIGSDFKRLVVKSGADADGLQFQPAASDALLGRRLELQAMHQNGHTFPIDLVLSRVQLAGEAMLVGVVRDITERRQMEQLKTEFISTVSHELRTPLTSIRGSLGLLTDKLVAESPSKAQQLISIALQNSERLTRLINDILDLEKAEAGRMQLQLAPQSLAALAAQAIEANRAYGERQQVRFTLLNEGVDQSVPADADRIMQVLANLLSNAIKHSPVDSEVKVQVESRQQCTRVTVYDQGPGIPIEFHSRIFSRFAQADANDARRKSGSGLGLAIAKSLVEQHGGKIGFSSDASTGTAFWFELPTAAYTST